jgi:hypothetical protein
MQSKQMSSSVIAIAGLVFAHGAMAQNYAIPWHSTDNGGATVTGGTYTLTGVIGQADAGTIAAGTYELQGGFLAGLSGGADTCTVADAPIGDAAPGDIGFGTKNRYLTFTMGAGGEPIAIRVRLDAVPGYEYAEGREMWVQQPTRVTEASGSNDSAEPGFWAATLACTPYFDADWSAYGRVDVYNDALVPGASFSVQAIGEACDAAQDGSYSDPLVVNMSGWGDLVQDCGVQPCTAPEGTIDFVDISAVVEKFKNEPAAPRKARTDVINSDVLLPAPDRKVDFVDIASVVEAFRGSPPVLPGPPVNDPCGSAAKAGGTPGAASSRPPLECRDTGRSLFSRRKRSAADNGVRAS